MPTIVFTEFTCLGADLLTNLQTAILASDAWSRPNTTTYPHLYKATTTRGAQMVVDLNYAAPALTNLSLGFYTSHDGTTAGDLRTGFLRTKRVNTGTFATTTYRGTVSVGKEHIFVAVEGPRGGETNADNANYGSMKSYFFLCDLKPYHAGDTTPCVILNTATTNNASSAFSTDGMVYASRNAGDTVSWAPGHLAVLDYPSGNSGVHMNNQQFSVLDGGKLQSSPYVFFGNEDGMRGRLLEFSHLGYNYATLQDVDLPPVGASLTRGGKVYRTITVNKSDASGVAYGAFGAVNSSSGGTHYYSPVVAVPYSAA